MVLGCNSDNKNGATSWTSSTCELNQQNIVSLFSLHNALKSNITNIQDNFFGPAGNKLILYQNHYFMNLNYMHTIYWKGYFIGRKNKIFLDALHPSFIVFFCKNCIKLLPQQRADVQI